MFEDCKTHIKDDNSYKATLAVAFKSQNISFPNKRPYTFSFSMIAKLMLLVWSIFVIKLAV